MLDGARRRLHARRGKPPDPTEPMTVEAGLLDWERELVDRARGYTLTSPERLIATADAVGYLVERDIPGALVECGVWRGGSVLTMVSVLLRLGITDRDVYLYDTFEGMTAPSDRDTSRFQEPGAKTWARAAAAGKRAWDTWFEPEVFDVDSVRALLRDTGYPEERIFFVVGPVEETLPAVAPESIALLRLDTDWYESTRHELECLYPRLSTGGVLIIDDYGHWDGCRTAVDEYFANEARLLLQRTDYTGRMAVKA